MGVCNFCRLHLGGVEPIAASDVLSADEQRRRPGAASAEAEALGCERGRLLMRLTLSVIKADVGSVGGHTKPSTRMIATVETEVAKAICKGLLIDGFICHTGDDIAIIMTHTRGEGSSEVHQFAWKAFLAATSVAKTSGLYGAGQDLLVDAPSGNIRGAGPAVAELSFDHNLSGARPAESFTVFAADVSIDKEGRFSESYTDFFDNPAWDEVVVETIRISGGHPKLGRALHKTTM
jgi:fructose 1,6-bisphosphatase